MMIPKEKANELVQKLKPYMYCYAGSGMLTNTIDAGVELDYAKKCALIAVDEILADNKFIGTPTGNQEYWEEVKKEIQSL